MTDVTGCAAPRGTQPVESRRPGARLRCGAMLLDLDSPKVMGVLNVTPDSFSDGGQFSKLEAATSFALEMIAAGASIIDVGGESTRPGAEPVPVAEELRRVLPVIEALAARSPAVISVDTSKPEVMRAATQAGAGLINDVYALRAPGALAAAAESRAAICLMHMQGEPRTMQREPSYRDVVSEVTAFLEERIRACEAAGIERDRLLVDPGFGFGKRLEHNLALLAALDRLAAQGVPLLVGVSRKSMIGALTGRSVQGRLAGGLAVAAIAVRAGARVIRTHDVAPTMDVVRVADAVRRAAVGDLRGDSTR